MSKKLFQVSGKKFSLDSSAVPKFEKRPGGWWIADVDGERVRFRASDAKGRFSVFVGGKVWTGTLSDGRASVSESSDAGSDADLVAQFPGKIRKILTTEGAAVLSGDKLILVEAMKMEFAIKAPF